MFAIPAPQPPDIMAPEEPPEHLWESLPEQDHMHANVLRERFERAAELNRPHMETAKQCVEFVEGKQWTEEEKEKARLERRPLLTINKIRPLVKLAYGYHLSNQTDLRYLPAEDGTQALADAISKQVKQISEENQLPYVDAEVFYDGLVGGRGWYDVRLDFAKNANGEARVRSGDPFSHYPDPDGDTYDPGDWGHVIETKMVSIDEIEAVYGPAARDMAIQFAGWGTAHVGLPSYGRTIVDEVTPYRRFGGETEGARTPRLDAWGRWVDTSRKAIRLVDFQYMQRSPGLFIVDLGSGYMERVPSHWTEQKVQLALSFLAEMGTPATIQRRTEKRVRWTQMVGDVILRDIWSPYRTFTKIPFFPYFRRGVTGGMVEDLIGPQMELNARRSALVNIDIRTAKGGWMIPEGGLTVEEESNLRRFGSAAGVIVKYKARLNDSTTLTGKPEAIVPSQMATGTERLEQKFADDMKQVAGINDSALGNVDKVQSGRAIEARQRQTVVGLEGFIKNYQRTKELLGRKLLEIVQEHYTEERLVITQGDDGQQESIVINQQSAGTITNNITMGRYRLAVDETPMSSTFLAGAFQEMLDLIDRGAPIPWDEVIQASTIRNKKKIVERVQANQLAMGQPPAPGQAPPGDPTQALGAPPPQPGAAVNAPAIAQQYGA